MIHESVLNVTKKGNFWNAQFIRINKGILVILSDLEKHSFEDETFFKIRWPFVLYLICVLC